MRRSKRFWDEDVSMSNECPLCGGSLTEEEGLLWCDVCGINEDSYSFKEALENKQRWEDEFYKECQDE